MHLEWGLSEHTSTDRALNLKKEIYIRNRINFFTNLWRRMN